MPSAAGDRVSPWETLRVRVASPFGEAVPQAQDSASPREDADVLSSTSSTSKKAGSMKQLGRAKRQESTLTGLDVETSPRAK